MPEMALVSLGAALGGMARFGVSELAARWCGRQFPWGTLAVNLSGAFAIGLFIGLAPAGMELGNGPHGPVWQFTGVGFLGAYTTVSSFSLETLSLTHDRKWGRALANIAMTVSGCLTAAAVGLAAGAWLAGMPA